MEALYEITPASVEQKCVIPLFLARVSAGFPSPAEDYIEESIDLNRYLIEHPAATFFVRVTGSSMIEAGIHDGDLLLVDRAADPRDGSIVIAILFGDLTVKRIRRQGKQIFLVPDNQAYEPIEVTNEMDFQIWGVCRYVIHSL